MRPKLVAGPAALFLALLLAVTSDVGWVLSVDADVARELHEAVRGSPGTVDVLTAVTSLGTSAGLYAVVAAVAAWALVARRPGLAGLAVLVTVTGGILNHLVRHGVGRHRPVFPDPVAVGGGPGFPSGHAMNSAVVFGTAVVMAGALAPGWRRRLAAGAAVLVAAIGATRVALGVHYLTDVIAGWALGLAWVLAGAALLAAPNPSGAAEQHPGVAQQRRLWGRRRRRGA